jgi:protein-disulfide isomerase
MKSQKLLIALVTSSFILCISGMPGETQDANQPGTAAGDKGIEQAIHDYILAHPEVLIQSLRTAKEREQERLAALAKSKIGLFKRDFVDDPAAPVLGNPKGDVTLVEFFDYRCPYCRQVEPFLQALIRSDPGLRVVQKEFPILGPASVYAARVALAANKQGKLKEFHVRMMARKPNIDEATVLKVAEEAGLDIDRLKSEMNGPDIDTEIARTREIAQALRLNGTPAFIVGSELVPGATDLETLRSMLDDARRGVN